jgi:hypothetical protein
VERDEGSLKRELSVELKRLNGMIITYHALLGSPHAKALPTPQGGPSLVETLLSGLLEPRPRKRR